MSVEARERPNATQEPPDRPSRVARLRYRLNVARHDPTLAIGIVLTAVLAYLVVVPIITLVIDGLQVQYGDQQRAQKDPGEWTTYYLWRVFRSPISELLFWEPLVNTLVVVVGTTVIALLLGGSMAWLLARTDMFGRKWFATALVVPYILPSWTFALAWLTIFKNRRVGGQLGLMEALGATPPDWLAYGRVPIIITLGMHYFPFVLLLVGNALRRLDSQLEDSARILGAPRRTINRKIVLPLVRPALTSAILLVTAKVIGTFGTPYILGLPVDYNVLATSLYQSINSRQTGVGAVLAATIVVIGVSILLIDARLVREYRRFVTIGGKGAMGRVNRLGRWRLPAFLAAAGVFTLCVVVPLGTLFLSTIMVVPGRFELSNFTLDFWIGDDLDSVGFPQGILVSEELYTAAWNSVRIVGLASIICAVLGLLVGYVVVRLAGTRLSSFLRQAAFLPYLVPGIAFAAAYLSLFAVPRGPIPALYGTFTILVLAMVVNQLPFSSRAGISAMMQLGREPEEAAQVCGAGWWRRTTRVVMPIQKGSLAVGVVMPFISGIKELSVVIMLATSGTQLLTTLSVDLVEYGYTQLANAVVLVIAFVSFTMTYIAQRLTGTSLAAGLQG
ncbi:iron ABC transporter permease [Nocardioides sp. YIM 152315]|uniref:ABC transporter permease n=1 Tax=Nocardioides sp. YIM 152315 TaxID=3031760 RepID=UPI0023DAFA41|nr:iron ABC transporter permease [Nocardioides sp. YIM 152315]MDF1605481.1 iron ABC transporter permease [Nocardioides sp. YIM 152315]